MPPSSDAVREQLERIVKSDGFANADRMIAFLRFVVARALAGEGDQVKEYVIGVEVFRRDAEYDPRLDSIVRVEARRLRTKLDEYYAGPGREDAVLVRIPRGSYVPVFESREVPSSRPVASPLPPSLPAAPAAVVSSVDQRRRAGFRIALGLMALTIALVVVAAAAWRTGLWATTGAKPSVAVLPFAQYSTDPAEALFAAELTDRITSELARTRLVGVVSHTSAAQFANRKRPLREIAQALDAELIMEGTVRRDGGLVRVDARLVSGVTDRKVWVETYVATDADLPGLPRRIATGVAAAAGAAERHR